MQNERWEKLKMREKLKLWFFFFINWRPTIEVQRTTRTPSQTFFIHSLFLLFKSPFATLFSVNRFTKGEKSINCFQLSSELSITDCLLFQKWTDHKHYLKPSHRLCRVSNVSFSAAPLRPLVAEFPDRSGAEQFFCSCFSARETLGRTYWSGVS